MTEGDRIDRIGQESAELTDALPTERLAQEAKDLLEAFAEKILTSVGDKVSDKVNEFSQGLLDKLGSEDGGGPGVKAAVSGLTALTQGKSPVRAAFGAGMTGLKEKAKKFFGGGKGKKGKVINIVETIDVGAPLRVVYNQWTQYEDFSSFMKKVEGVERPSEEKSNWKAQVFWSHRSWEATTQEQVADDRIIWRSKGAKGFVDGAVTFTELAPRLTRICLVMEYHPQGLFEHTGNLWRAQGRRARLEFKNFRRHVMVHGILKADEIEGWRGEIREGEVVKSHEDALEEEKRAEKAGEEEPAAREEESRAEEEPEEPEEREDEEEEEEEEPEPDEAAEAGPEEAPEEEPEEEPERRPRRARRRPPPDEAAEAGPEEEPEEEPERRPRRARRRPPADEDERPRRRAARRRAASDEEDEEGEEEEEERKAPARPPGRRRSSRP